MYWALRGFLERLAREGRIRLDLIPNEDLGALARTVRRGETRLVWVETPANPTCEIVDLEGIFQKFHNGARFGLAICRAIVKLHGGRIWAERLPEVGTAFRFSLPLETPPAMPAEVLAK